MSDDNEFKSNDCQRQDGTPISNDSDTWNARKVLLEMRNQAVAASLAQRDESMTVDLLITQCHGLVTSNREIWERCVPFHCQTIKDSDSEIPKYIFYRVGYFNVIGTRNALDSFKIRSTMEVTRCNFEIPMHLPARLQCFALSLQPKAQALMPNYELLLQQSMLLNDDVLAAFLVEFKSFLEEQQVSLGMVDSWLLQAHECASVLEDLFGVTISYDSATWQVLGASFMSCQGQQSLTLSKCSRCLREFRDHNGKEGWKICREKQPGSFPLNGHTMDLLEYVCTDSIEFKFNIETSQGQVRLIRLVRFLRNNMLIPK